MGSVVGMQWSCADTRGRKCSQPSGRGRQSSWFVKANTGRLRARTWLIFYAIVQIFIEKYLLGIDRAFKLAVSSL